MGVLVMVRPAFDRDNVLSTEERTASARKCLSILEGNEERLNGKAQQFVADMRDKVDRFGCTEGQLQWLRDLVDKVL